jgi:hypothetical protein
MTKNELPFAGFVIIQRNICPKCNGTKIIRNPIWDKFWQGREWGAKMDTVAELQQFMQDNGAPTVPAEAFSCPVCSGTGNEDIEVDLKEVLIKLGVMKDDQKN